MLHIARVSLIPASPSGSIVNKNNATIQEVLNATQEPRIIQDDNIPNSTGNPVIKTYLEAEENSGFYLVHIDQYMIITKGGGAAVDLSDDLPEINLAPSGDTDLTNPIDIDVQDADVIRFWVTFESDAADAAEQLIMHIITSPDGVTFEEGEEWELPYSINQVGTNTPLHIPFEINKSIHTIRIVSFTNTSAAATISDVSVKYRIG